MLPHHSFLLYSFIFFGDLYPSHSQDDFPLVRKLFLCKVIQYIKERTLDAKYTCAFLLGIDDYRAPQYEEVQTQHSNLLILCGT
jgi:sister chromatid cohesion protein PDS5